MVEGGTCFLDKARHSEQTCDPKEQQESMAEIANECAWHSWLVELDAMNLMPFTFHLTRGP